jgi:hypothetical protein
MPLSMMAQFTSPESEGKRDKLCNGWTDRNIKKRSTITHPLRSREREIDWKIIIGSMDRQAGRPVDTWTDKKVPRGFLTSNAAGSVDGVSSQWIAGISAGGRPAHSTFKYNPAFELIVQVFFIDRQRGGRSIKS